MNFWLSATNHIREDTYVWMSSGQDVSFARWCPPKPCACNDDDDYADADADERVLENCVELNYGCNYGMTNKFCSDEKNYICKNRNYGRLV